MKKLPSIMLRHGMISTLFFLSVFLFLVSCGLDNGGSTDAAKDSAVGPPAITSTNCQTLGNSAALRSIAFSNSDNLWQAFRLRFPYHIQLIGKSKIESDQSCVLLISEPPPHVDTTDLDQMFACYPHQLIVKEHRIGYDGWAKDVLITLAGVDELHLDTIKKALNNYLFGTDYGLYSLSLKSDFRSEYSAALKQKVNYQIAPNELEEWFCGEHAIVFDGGTIPDLLNDNALTDFRSIRYSEQKGFVVWVLRKDANIAGENAKIRRFFLDVDLIVGAIEKNDRIAIIGRERQASVFDLPPLRAETIQQLAAANDKQLAQSYERYNMMACKLPDGRDWAPIFLSDELLNTEYGSLLDITDQLLKSWSQNGETRYENFGYKRPEKWGFDESLSTIIDAKFNAASLTFNWNTAGAVYQYNKENYAVVGLNRVGSLPVSYIPDEESSESNEMYKNVEPYERQGYDFFSNCNDANLIRAAQYAAIYQIFKSFGIQSYVLAGTGFNTAGTGWNTFRPLENQAEIFIDKIKNLSDEDINYLADKSIKDQKKSARKNGVNLAGLTSNFDEITAEFVTNLKDLRKSFLRLDENPVSRAAIIRMLVNRNGISSADISQLTEETVQLYKEISATLSRNGDLKWYYPSLNINIDSLVNDFVSYNANSPAQWIKTPSIVLSWNKDMHARYGGHNIDAEVLKVETDISISKGSILAENGVIKINPEDQGRLTPEFLRKLGVETKNEMRNGMGGINEFSFGDIPPRPPRDIHDVFADPELPNDARRGFIAGIHDVLEVKRIRNNTYLVAGKEVNSCEALQDALFLHATGDKKAAIVFEGFDEGGVQVRLVGVEYQIQMRTALTGHFRPLEKDELLSLTSDDGINRQAYVFEKEPVVATN